MRENEKSTAKKSDLTRARILDAAAVMSRRKSLSDMTVREICAEADVSTGSFYNCFDSLDALFTMMQRELDLNFAKGVEEAAAGRTAVDKLFCFTRHYALLNMNNGPKELAVILKPVPESAEGLSARPMHELLERYIREGQASGELTAAYPAERLREIMIVALRGCSYNWCSKNGSYDLTEEMLTHIRIILHAVTNVF